MKASTASLSTNAFGRQIHWDIVHGKNEYLYSFVLLVIMRNLCPCGLLVLVSADINISLFGTLPISFIIYFTNQQLEVKWGNVISHRFGAINGVK